LVVTLVGVLFFFAPIAQADTVTGPLLPPAVSLLVYITLSIALFDWIAQQMHSGYKAAFVIAASQFVLVNVDFVLRGERGLMTAIASTALLSVTWFCVAFAYSIFAKDEKR